MSLQSQQRGLFVMISRKRERWPLSEGRESPLLAPPTPPAADEKRSFDDEEEEHWGVEMPEWGDNNASGNQQQKKKSRDRLWCADDDSLLFFHQGSKDSSNFPKDSASHVPFAMSTADLSAEESYYIGTRSKLLTLSPEDLEDIANTDTPVTPSLVVSRAANDEPAVVQRPPTIRDLQSGESEDEGSSNLPGYRKHDQLSIYEKSVRSSPKVDDIQKDRSVWRTATRRD